jgi:hypothetical protein
MKMQNFYLMKFMATVFILIISSLGQTKEYEVQFSAPTEETVFLLPVPHKEIALASQLSLVSNGIKVECDIVVLNIWNSNSQQKFIRLLSIEISKHDKIEPNQTVNFTLRWDSGKKNLPIKNKRFYSPPSLIYPNKSWLTESILLHPHMSKVDTFWYTQPQSLYANFVTNESLLEQYKYPKTKYSQWLFDRPRAILQLFILTNDDKWLDEGIKVSQFYLKNLDSEGQFKLKKDFDLKYLMPNGLLYYYFLTGDSRIPNILKKLFERSLIWSPDYENDYKFWTERHQAAALNLAISYWEISGDKAAKNRIESIISATAKMVFFPKEEWAIKNCPQHTYISHEGKPGISPVCSPWMMALLADGLWRYYHLTHDKESAALLNAFGDFMINDGIYFTDKKFSDRVLPLYLSSMTNNFLEIKNPYTDGQHACDVASLIGKSLYIKTIREEDTFLLKELFSVFVQQCKDINKRYKNNQKDYLPMMPPRRFGWTYSTTSDLPWLESWLNTPKYNE